MRVSSPIGDMPFEARSIRLSEGGLQVDGVMGAWPATVSISSSDVPALLRLVAKPAAVAAALITIVGVAAVARSNRKSR